MKKLKIDDEFEKLKPAATKAQKRVLESLILHDGCRDAIVVWGDIILDGTLRYCICQKHNLPFKIYEEHIKSREEAMLWIINNELGRRHLGGGFKGIESLLKLKGILEKQKNVIERKECTEKNLCDLAGVNKRRIYETKYILKHGSLEQITRARKGNSGNSPTTIYREIKRLEDKQNGRQN